MGSEAIEELVQDKFKLAGIDFKKENSCGLQIHDRRFYEKVLKNGSLGLGESYMDGWWDAEHIDDLMYHVTKSDLQSNAKLSLCQCGMSLNIFCSITIEESIDRSWKKTL